MEKKIAQKIKIEQKIKRWQPMLEAPSFFIITDRTAAKIVSDYFMKPIQKNNVVTRRENDCLISPDVL